MVICCVPKCGTDSWRCDPSISFHDFPSKPDLAAKWIQQVNIALNLQSGPMWIPKGKPMLCSKHFLSTDFKDDSDVLKSRVIPTVFGHKYIGQGTVNKEKEQRLTDFKSGPLIVKIKTEDGGTDDVFISDVQTQSRILEEIINEPENISPHNIEPTSITNQSLTNTNKTYSKFPNMGVRHKTPTPAKSNKTFIKNKTIQINKNTSNSSSKFVKKRDNNDNNLIEIGPNTFLKINPDVIKINKKQTPSGNTVLQFLMDQKLANTIGADVLPKIVQGAISNIGEATTNVTKIKSSNTSTVNDSSSVSKDTTNSKNPVIQRILGHLIDTHVCKDTCTDVDHVDNSIEINEDQQNNSIDSSMSNIDDTQNKNINENKIINTISAANTETANENPVSSDKTDSSCIAKAPVLLTTNMSLAHCFMEKTKYLSNLRQKSRQIASLKQKVSSLNKKIEELEDKCVVQERQLSFTFLKRLRTIRKNASKGDPPATYILEQIRAYTGQKQMRWSDSTLNQCAIWCKKAPYAYEYFKKADFFKLPCLGTVKRYMKKHSEMTFSNKSNSNVNGDDDSSSDFDFDEEDSIDEQDKEITGNNEAILCETVLSEEMSNPDPTQSSYNNVEETSVMDNAMEVELQEEAMPENQAVQNVKVENSSFPITVDGTSLELQELILPSGEVVQCYSSNLQGGVEAGGQYYIIPNAGDQNIDQEYSIVQSGESVPVILQNIDHSQLHQEQLIFITNSADQVECTETEVTTDR